jgi:hypothetical protein
MMKMNDCLGKEQDALLIAIANKHLGIKTLKERKSDIDDFHSLSVWEIEAALKEALRTGIDIGIQMGLNHAKKEL